MHIKLSRRRKRLLASIFALLMIFTIFLTSYVYISNRDKQLASTRYYGERIAVSISLAINESVSVSNTMANLFTDYGQMYLDDFGFISARQKEIIPSATGMYFTEKGVVKYAYPKENEAIIGFDMLANEEQKADAQKAIDTGRLTISGPHNLAEGGVGFIMRNPVMLDGNDFYGFAIIVLNWDMFVNNVLEKVEVTDAIYNFGVWKEGSNTLTDEYGYILRNCDHDVSKKIDIAINVPNDVWHLAIEPVEGWYSVGRVVPMFVVLTLLIVLLVFVLYRWMIGNAQRIYEIEHDELTGLLTRQAFYKRVETLINENPDKKYEIVASDIENFKMVNSVYGEAKGDEVLQYLANSYRYALENGVCARYGGDQFVCIYPAEDNPGSEVFLQIVNNIALDAPVRNLMIKYGHYSNVDMTISINEMFDRALMAAKSIKNDYSRIVENYEGQVSRTHLRNQMLETEFEDALKTEEFKVWYQPKFDVANEKLVGAEALVRWIRNDGTIIPPGVFIPLYEQDGMIVRLDEYVFRKVCDSIKHWSDIGIKAVPVSVNLSRSSLYREGVIEKYAEIVKEAGIDINMVPIELTESAELHSVQIKDLTVKLKNAGFQLHMDDFGAGFSSLASLNILPFDVIKLDKSIIDFIGDPGGEEIIRHTIQLAHFKNMQVVAEGVEKEHQLKFLKNNDCDNVQGYYYSPPKPEEDFIEFVKMYNE